MLPDYQPSQEVSDLLKKRRKLQETHITTPEPNIVDFISAAQVENLDDSRNESHISGNQMSHKEGKSMAISSLIHVTHSTSTLSVVERYIDIS